MIPRHSVKTPMGPVNSESLLSRFVSPGKAIGSPGVTASFVVMRGLDPQFLGVVEEANLAHFDTVSAARTGEKCKTAVAHETAIMAESREIKRHNGNYDDHVEGECKEYYAIY